MELAALCSEQCKATGQAQQRITFFAIEPGLDMENIRDTIVSGWLRSARKAIGANAQSFCVVLYCFLTAVPSIPFLGGTSVFLELSTLQLANSCLFYT